MKNTTNHYLNPSSIRSPYSVALFAVSLFLLQGCGGFRGATTPQATFFAPMGVAVDSADNTYVADAANCTIRKINPQGNVSTLAGTAGNCGSDDGTGAAASFDYPTGVAVDSRGTVYVADSYNSTIRKITPAGVVSTLAGTPGVVGSLDGVGASASFLYPEHLAVDSQDNVFVADENNDTIRKISPSGVVTTLAGKAGSVGSTDGTGTAATFNLPTAIAVDQNDNLYVSDTNNGTIRKITPGGVVTTLAGTPGVIGSRWTPETDGTGAAAVFTCPSGITVDPRDNVFVADYCYSNIREISPAGVVRTIAGVLSSIRFGFADGVGANVIFNSPRDIAIAPDGSLIVADPSNDVIRKITPSGVTTTVAGVVGTWGSSDKK